ncbi:MAG: Uncharacterized protein LiPW39_66 [Parcubacteria group bacterium LiPW_39]|nr:MAG: Uncharacterized protein LiPW39_66 [Parcubacteria group bacterium LiPW_39]
MKTTLKRVLGSGILALAFPLVAAAQVTQILDKVKAVLNYVIVILFVLVTLYFIWGVVQYVSAAGDEEKLKNGKQHMIWGIIGMVAMAAVWGIVKIIVDYFVLGGGTPPIPAF